jgi:hypothetical protein
MKIFIKHIYVRKYWSIKINNISHLLKYNNHKVIELNIRKIVKENS